MIFNSNKFGPRLALVAVIIGCSLFSFAQAFQATNTEQRSLTSFTGIEVAGLVNVTLEASDKESIDIRVKDIDLKDIVSSVENDILLVSTKGAHRGESIDITVHYVDLNFVKTGGAATIKNRTPIHSEALTIEITGSGDANLDIDTDSLKVSMQGNGNLKLRGRASEQTLVSHGGGGSFDNSKLQR